MALVRTNVHVAQGDTPVAGATVIVGELLAAGSLTTDRNGNTTFGMEEERIAYTQLYIQLPSAKVAVFQTVITAGDTITVDLLEVE